MTSGNCQWKTYSQIGRAVSHSESSKPQWWAFQTCQFISCMPKEWIQLRVDFIISRPNVTKCYCSELIIEGKEILRLLKNKISPLILGEEMNWWSLIYVRYNKWRLPIWHGKEKKTDILAEHEYVVREGIRFSWIASSSGWKSGPTDFIVHIIQSTCELHTFQCFCPTTMNKGRGGVRWGVVVKLITNLAPGGGVFDQNWYRVEY